MTYLNPCSQHDRATKRIYDVYKTVVHPAFIVIEHGNIDRVRSLDFLLRLFKGFVLEVEAVFTNLVVVILGDTVKTLMNEHGSYDRTGSIKDSVCREAEYGHAPGS